MVSTYDALIVWTTLGDVLAVRAAHRHGRLAPVSSLIGDIYRHIEEAHALVGARSGEAYQDRVRPGGIPPAG